MQLDTRYLTEKEAVAAVGYAHRPYAIAAWRFLSKTGYINFGVAPGMSAKQSNNRDQPAKGTVVVVGAGMAGKVAVCALVMIGPTQATCIQAYPKLHACMQHDSKHLGTAAYTLHEVPHSGSTHAGLLMHSDLASHQQHCIVAKQHCMTTRTWCVVLTLKMTCRFGSSSSAQRIWVQSRHS